MNRICQEFSCLPSVALRELRRDPEFMLDLLATRDYQRVLHAFDDAKGNDKAEVPDHPYVDVIWDVEQEIAAEHAAQRNTRRQDT